MIEEDPEVKGALLERYGTTKRSDIAAVVFSDRDELASGHEHLASPRERDALEGPELGTAWHAPGGEHVDQLDPALQILAR